MHVTIASESRSFGSASGSASSSSRSAASASRFAKRRFASPRRGGRVFALAVLLAVVFMANNATAAEPRLFLPSAAGLVPLERDTPDQGQSSLSMPALSSSAPTPDAEANLADQARPWIELILAGPNAEESARGIRAAFPEGARLAGVEFDPATGTLTVRIEFPLVFLDNPARVAERFDWMNGSVIKTLQEFPIRRWTLLARRGGDTEFAPLDTFLPPDPATEYQTEPDSGGEPVDESGSSAHDSAPSDALSTNASASAVSAQSNATIATIAPLAQFPRAGSSRPQGGLSGKAVYMNPGHGWVWGTSAGADYWRLQRSFVQNNYEDYSNAELINQYLFAYLYNAGADVFSVRELDPNPKMVVVDNDDGNDGTKGFFETGGSWSNSSLAGFANGRIPYVDGQDPFSYGTTRLAPCVVGVPTHSATWIPSIPESGWYNVYVDHAAYSNRSPQAHYRVHHAGGTTDYYLDQRMRRFTWIFIGNYYFEAGVHPETGKVALFNDSTSAAHYVSADAVRFGGGMGLVSRGASGTSNRQRFDEDARYNTQFSGAPTSVYDPSSHDEADGWTGRPRFGRWLKQAAEAYGAPAQESVFISSHTNAGGGTGLGTFVYTGEEGTWHDTFRNFVHDEVLNDLNKGYSTNFKNHGTGKKYGTYGENNPSNVSNLMPIFLGEWLFHDSATDMAMYHDPEFRRMMARAIYQGVVKFWANRNGTAVHLLPEPPRNVRLRQLSATSVQLDWDAPLTDSQNIAGDAATGYKVYQSAHGRGFPGGAPVAATSHVVTGLTPGTTYYFRVSATNAGGESFPSPVLAVKTPAQPAAPRLLLVHAFDKLDIATRLQLPGSGATLYRQLLYRMNTMDQLVDHARAINARAKPVAFDSCQADAIDGGSVTLTDYNAVIWVGGIQAEVSTADPSNDASITAAQRNALAAFLASGGSLFITGSKIAWDLDRAGGSTFVDTSLRSSYAGNSSVTQARAAAGSIFEGLAPLPFGDGTQGTYVVYESDTLTPAGGAIPALRYDTSAPATVDGFESIGGWKDPNYSSQTNADPACTLDITAGTVRSGAGAGDLYYVWGAGDFIRLYNSALPAFPADSDFSVWVYGDGSGHKIRICLRDSDADLFVNAYTTVDFTGWRQITWPDVANNPGAKWAGGGDGAITGPNLQFDGFHIAKGAGGNAGHLYFDDAQSSPAAGGGANGPVAGVQFQGDYRLVYLALPFETLTSPSQRDAVMTRVLDFLLPDTPARAGWILY